MLKDNLLELLNKDLRNSRISVWLVALTFGGVVLILMTGVFFTLQKDPDTYGAAYSLVTGIAVAIGSVIVALIRIKKRTKRCHIIYHAISMNPDRIVWIYKRNFTRRVHLMTIIVHSIIIYDDAKNTYETIRTSATEEQDELWYYLTEVCPNAVQGYRLEWMSTYRHDPYNFRAAVTKDEQQFK